MNLNVLLEIQVSYVTKLLRNEGNQLETNHKEADQKHCKRKQRSKQGSYYTIQERQSTNQYLYSHRNWRYTIRDVLI